MNKAFELISYRIETAKTGQSVPVINDKPLHSLEDPFREAGDYFMTQEPLFVKNKNILVLGLGFGYHVQTILEKLQTIHGEDFQVQVVEPLPKVLEDCRQYAPLAEERLHIFCEDSISALYSQKKFTDFLLKKPGIVYHHQSFGLHYPYFKELITFKAPQAIGGWSPFIEDPSLREYLDLIPSERDFQDHIQSLKREGKKVKNPFDFLLLALDEI